MSSSLLAASSLDQTALASLPSPSTALLFHTTGNSLVLVTAHEVIHDRAGQPHIGPGRVALPADEARLAALLSSRTRRGRIALTPPDVLFHDEASLAWWLPPTERPMFLRDAEGNTSEPVVRWPSLVALVVNRKLHVVALASQDRPTLSDPVFHAPLGNVYGDSSVCTGSARLPRGNAVLDVDGWSNVINASYFTHDNHSHNLAKPNAKGRKGQARSIDRAGNYRATAYWRERDGVSDPMPVADMVPLNLSLGDWLEAIIDGSGE